MTQDPRTRAREFIEAHGLSSEIQVRADGNVMETADGVAFVEAVIVLPRRNVALCDMTDLDGYGCGNEMPCRLHPVAEVEG